MEAGVFDYYFDHGASHYGRVSLGPEDPYYALAVVIPPFIRYGLLKHRPSSRTWWKRSHDSEAASLNDAEESSDDYQYYRDTIPRPSRRNSTRSRARTRWRAPSESRGREYSQAPLDCAFKSNRRASERRARYVRVQRRGRSLSRASTSESRQDDDRSVSRRDSRSRIRHITTRGHTYRSREELTRMVLVSQEVTKEVALEQHRARVRRRRKQPLRMASHDHEPESDSSNARGSRSRLEVESHRDQHHHGR